MMRAVCAWIHGRIITAHRLHHHSILNQRQSKKKVSSVHHRIVCSNVSVPTDEGEEADGGQEGDKEVRYAYSKIHGRITCILDGNQLKNFTSIQGRFLCSNIFAQTDEESVAEDKDVGKEDESEGERGGCVISEREILQAHNPLDPDISERTEEKAEDGENGKREDEDEGRDVMSKRDILFQEGLSESQINKILSAEPRSDKLGLLLHLLRNRGITGTIAGNFLCSNLSFINSNLNSFRLKLELLEEAGFTRDLLKKCILLKSGSLSLCSSPHNLQKHVSFLKGLGLDPPGICLTMARLPEFFKLSIEKNVTPRCELLYSKGMSKESLAYILRSHPRVFSGSLEPGLLKRLELLKYFGLDLKTKGGVRALGLWSKYAPKRLMVKFDYMKTLGFSDEQAVLMVRRQPNVLCMREDAMNKKISYLCKTLGRDIEELLSCPGYMTSSLEKRLIPRFSLINQLQQQGLLVKKVPLCSIVTTSDEAFAKRFKK